MQINLPPQYHPLQTIKLQSMYLTSMAEHKTIPLPEDFPGNFFQKMIKVFCAGTF